MMILSNFFQYRNERIRAKTAITNMRAMSLSTFQKLSCLFSGVLHSKSLLHIEFGFYMLHFSSLNLYQQLFSGNRSPKKLSRLRSTVKSKFLAKMTTIMRIKMILTKEISFLSYPLF
jgi:hypothetical protein